MRSLLIAAVAFTLTQQVFLLLPGFLRNAPWSISYGPFAIERASGL